MGQKYYKKSDATGKTYDVFDTVVIMNARQAAFYVSRNVPLEDLRVSEDRKTGEPVFCYVFRREDTREAYDEWCRRKEEGHG